MKIEEAHIGQQVFGMKRTRMHPATVLAVYQHPQAIRIRYTTPTGRCDEWVLKPEEVFTPEEKEKLDNPANQ